MITVVMTTNNNTTIMKKTTTMAAATIVMTMTGEAPQYRRFGCLRHRRRHDQDLRSEPTTRHRRSIERMVQCQTDTREESATNALC
jgi:hypothetical protein